MTSPVPRWLVPAAAVGVVVLLVVIALARGPVLLDPDTPEGTIQEYLLALDERRLDEALELVHPQTRGTCTGEDLEQVGIPDFTAQLGFSSGFGGVITEGFEESIGPGRPAPAATESVDVTITRLETGSSWDEYVTFQLADEDDFWWIVGEPWPYFTWACGSR